MANLRLEGWLFDVDDLGYEVALWVYTNSGKLVRLTDAFRLPVYASGKRDDLKKLASELIRKDLISGVNWTEKQEFWSGEKIEVLELFVVESSRMPQIRRIASARDRQFTFYNCDIPASQYYLYLRQLFPLCNLACEVDRFGQVIEIAATSSPWEADYNFPSLRILNMKGEKIEPVSDQSYILLECEGDHRELKIGDGGKAIEECNAFLSRHDPDIILSERGDSILMPTLFRLAEREGLHLRLDRHSIVTKRKIETEGRTYYSYGKILYKGPSYPLFGRWHIDSRNSFVHHETGLDGVVELARLAKVPVQRMARTSPGTAMSSMQLDRAVMDGILVPWRKSEPEQYKTALELLTVDKGGLVFVPPVGGFEQVAEIDFASMYPSIMVHHNISPETVLCGCCENRRVPEAGYNVCEKRRGLIPRTLEPMIERRKAYKQMMREETSRQGIYDSRQTAIKWMLVSCFGYLGYRNARFGRIEAHEAVTAFGREKLLQAKELAERAGFRVLHAITDCLWMKRDEMNRDSVLALCDEITRVCKVEMSLEGIYRWIIFLPSKVRSDRAVPARYYGVFDTGKMKMRGLACRRMDTPGFIREAQLDMLAVLAQARTLAERGQLMQKAKELLDSRIKQLERGEVDPLRLIVRRTLTKEIDDYRVETRTAIAVKKLRDKGVRVHPGESVRYVIAYAKANDKTQRVEIESSSYDAGAYVRLLMEAAQEVRG